MASVPEDRQDNGEDEPAAAETRSDSGNNMSVLTAPFIFGGGAQLHAPSVTPSRLPPMPYNFTTRGLTPSPQRPSQLPHRSSQSSPILPSQTIPAAPFSTFSARQTRPNPVIRKREDLQATRRNLFLNNVRRRRDDQQWMRRGGDQELLKVEWIEQSRQLRHEKESDAQGLVSEADIDDAEHLLSHSIPSDVPEEEYMLLDAMEQDEEMELELALSQSQQQAPTEPLRPRSMYSDDEEYDQLFEELWEQEVVPGQDSGRMDMG